MLPRPAGEPGPQGRHTVSLIGGTIQSVQWDVADGQVVAGALDEKAITVRFDAPGQHWVDVRVTDADGHSFEMSVPVWVRSDA